MKGGIKYGIDFRGGAMMYVKFSGPPPLDKIRTSLSSKIPGGIDVQSLTGANANEVIISTELKDEKALEQTRTDHGFHPGRDLRPAAGRKTGFQ